MNNFGFIPFANFFPGCKIDLVYNSNLKMNPDLQNSAITVSYLTPFFSGMRPRDGVPDMTVISDIDEFGINENLHVRYKKDNIYVGHLSYHTIPGPML